MVVLQVSYSHGDGFHVLEKEKQTNLNKFPTLIQYHRAYVYNSPNVEQCACQPGLILGVE